MYVPNGEEENLPIEDAVLTWQEKHQHRRILKLYKAGWRFVLVNKPIGGANKRRTVISHKGKQKVFIHRHPLPITKNLSGKIIELPPKPIC